MVKFINEVFSKGKILIYVLNAYIKVTKRKSCMISFFAQTSNNAKDLILGFALSINMC